MRQFWQQLQTRTRDWAAKTYGTLPDVTLTGRRVVNGTDARHMLEHAVAFYFAAENSPGLAGIAIDTAGAVRNAAVRMNQDVASITDASPLFLKLLAEQAGTDLWDEIAVGLMKAGKSAAPFTDPVGAAGRFDAYWEFKLHAWDVAAGLLIVEEAGGLAVLGGEAYRPTNRVGPLWIASSGHVFDTARQKLLGG